MMSEKKSAWIDTTEAKTAVGFGDVTIFEEEDEDE